MKIKLTLPTLLAATLSSTAGTFTVATTTDSGPGSLRQAIWDANTNSGASSIHFNISGPPYTIFLNSLLPTITNKVIIDGYTQPGAQANTLANGDDATPNIELTTSNALTVSTGLSITAGDAIVQGLVINGFATCIGLSQKGSNIIAGNFLGLSPDGTNASPRTTGTGIFIATTGGTNLIGGPTPAARNVIAGVAYGLDLRAGSTNVVQGNFIGTDRHGTNAIGSAIDGISLQGSYAVIGGTNAAARNVISGNQTAIYLSSATHFTMVQGNYIGTDVTGTRSVPNTYGGISLGGQSNLIGGVTASPGMPPGNVISGNGARGIEMSGSGHRIQGNLIGLDASGSVALPNNNDGVLANGGSSLIGGTNAGEGNVISGNTVNGVNTISSGGSTNWIAGNWIGTDATGTLPLGNGSHGMRLSSVRSCTFGPGNVVAFNSGDGVAVVSTLAYGNFITGNSIYDNAQLGIDLSVGSGLDGPTANDPCDIDTAGANFLQNFPVLTNVIAGAGSTTIEGYMPGEANAGYRLEFFANDACDASGYGEGQTYLGLVNVAASANCANAFSTTLPVGSLAGKFITATATDTNNNTSEFSACFAIVAPPLPTLTIATAGAGQALISWTPATPGFGLQETLSLSPTNWVTSPSGATNPIAVSATNATKFYRLFKP